MTPDDVQALAVPVLAHRVRLAEGARYGGKAEAALIADLVARVDVPT